MRLRSVSRRLDGLVLLPLLCTVLFAALAPAPAAAFEIFGVRIFGSDPEPPPPDAVFYTVELTLLDEDDSLVKRLRGASRLFEEVEEPSPAPAALIATARGDYQRILASLYAEGHYGGTISIMIDGREASGLAPDAPIGDVASVMITVDPGPLYLFDNVAITNEPGPVLNDRTLPDTPQELGLRQGEPARSTVVLASEASLVQLWRERGHPKAEIAARTAVAEHARDELNVAIDVAPGPAAVFGGTTVSGTERMSPAFVAWYAGIEPGEPFDPDDLERARDQLRRLEVFQAYRIVEAPTVRDDGTLPIELKLAERKRRVIGAGAKFSSVDGFGGEVYWRHRNLFGEAEQLRLSASVGGVGADDPQEYNYRVAAEFLKPGVITPYTDLLASVYAEQDAPDTYRARTIGARVGLAHRIGDRLTIDGFAQAEASTIDMTDVGDGDFLFLSTPVAVNYDASNDEYDPTRGFKIGGKLEPYYEVQFNNVGLVSELEGSVYYGLANDRLVLAARASVGSIVGAPLDETPATRLFYAGGGGSIRGYPYRGVGPIDADGDVIGGRSYLTGSLEARVRVTENIGVVPFFDFGNAFRSEYPDFEEPLRYAVGIGARYKTGLGPLRLDVAVPLDPLDGDPSFAFYIGLGQAF